MESLKKLKYNREVENYFLSFKELEVQLKKAENEYVESRDKQERCEKEYMLQKEKIEMEMREFLGTYNTGEIYEMLELHEKLKHLTAEFSAERRR